MRYGERRKISAGTKVMLVLTPLVLIGTIILLSRLYSPVSRAGTADSAFQQEREAGVPGKQNTAGNSPEKAGTNRETRASDRVQTTGSTGQKRFTLTVAGTAVMEGEVRKSCEYKDVKAYDFSDVMSLLKNEIYSDVNILFLENIISDDEQVSDRVIPSAVTAMLKTAGFNMAACGFSGAWDKGGAGVAATRKNLIQDQIIPLGICDPENQDPVQVREYGGIPTAILQYTDTVASGVRKKMAAQNQSRTVPAADPEEIRNDILAARSQGAKAVIVLLNWGKDKEQPGKTQRELAQRIADAGADLIIGCGTRYTQTAEYLTTDGRQVLCVWSLGVTVSGNRDNVKRLSGYLFHAEVSMDRDGTVSISNPTYTPTYTWKSELSGKLSFHCMAANAAIPDGMEDKQQKTMGRCAEQTRKVLQDSVLQERKQE